MSKIRVKSFWLINGKKRFSHLKHVKQPDVVSGVPPETKPLKKVKKIIQKKVIKKLFCVDVLSLDADIFYSFVVNGEVTFPCAYTIMQSARSLGHYFLVFAGSPLLSYSFTV